MLSKPAKKPNIINVIKPKGLVSRNLSIPRPIRTETIRAAANSVEIR